MNTPSIFHRILTIFLIACAGTIIVHADTFKDDFSLDATRSPGKQLNGKKIPSCELTWLAPPALVFGGEGSDGYITLTKSASFLAKVPLPDKAETIQIEADVHPSPPDNNPSENSWVAIGFGHPDNDWDAQWKNGIFLLIHVSGDYSCFARTKLNSPNISIKGGPVPKYSAKRPNKLKLEYNQKERTVNAWINDKQIIFDYRLEEENGTPEAVAAGFSGYAQGTNAQSVDNFSLVTTP